MERKPLSSVNAKAVKEITQDSKSSMLKFRDGKGRVLFMVDEDNLFDADGNRFEIDVAFMA